MKQTIMAMASVYCAARAAWCIRAVYESARQRQGSVLYAMVACVIWFKLAQVTCPAATYDRLKAVAAKALKTVIA